MPAKKKKPASEQFQLAQHTVRLMAHTYLDLVRSKLRAEAEHQNEKETLQSVIRNATARLSALDIELTKQTETIDADLSFIDSIMLEKTGKRTLDHFKNASSSPVLAAENENSLEFAYPDSAYTSILPDKPSQERKPDIPLVAAQNDIPAAEQLTNSSQPISAASNMPYNDDGRPNIILEHNTDEKQPQHALSYHDESDEPEPYEYDDEDAEEYDDPDSEVNDEDFDPDNAEYETDDEKQGDGNDEERNVRTSPSAKDDLADFLNTIRNRKNAFTLPEKKKYF